MDSNLCRFNLLNSAIAELFAQVSRKGRITFPDRYSLRTELLNTSLSDEEKELINRLLYAVRRGRLEVVAGDSLATNQNP